MAPTLEMMRCDRRDMTLSRPGCAKLWLSANTGEKEGRPRPWEGRAACVACPVGAASAGRPISSVAGAVEVLRPVCPRCRRSGARMIRDRLCVSCQNREYETLRLRPDGTRGRNAKGGRPRLCDVLHAATLAISDSAGTRHVTEPSVVCAGEAMIAAARKATGWMAFTRPAASPCA